MSKCFELRRETRERLSVVTDSISAWTIGDTIHLFLLQSYEELAKQAARFDFDQWNSSMSKFAGQCDQVDSIPHHFGCSSND
jgi:hypothetical protein